MRSMDISLERALLSREEAVPLPPGLSPQETNRKIQEILNDHPEIFWFQGKWQMAGKDGDIFVIPMYTFPAETAAQAKNEIGKNS